MGLIDPVAMGSFFFIYLFDILNQRERKKRRGYHAHIIDNPQDFKQNETPTPCTRVIMHMIQKISHVL